jgi:hypothetical protein
MPHAAAPARGNAARVQKPASNGQAHAGKAQTHANRAATTATGTGTASTTRPVKPATTTNAAPRASGTTPSSTTPYAYTYGSGSGTRRYHAYGYGRGYRNRYYGGRYGYGRSQGNNRAVVARLRSAHASLARVDHDYQGHRVRAMHQISMAIRQLTHRSMVYRNTGFAGGMNNGMAMKRLQGGRGGNGNGNRAQRMPQAQSDARMGQAMRTLEGVNMQLSSQGTNTTGHARARGHVQHAIRELNTALSIR